MRLRQGKEREMRKVTAGLLAAVLLSGCGGMLPTLHLGAGISAPLPDEPTLTNTYQIDLFGRVDLASSFQLCASLGYVTYDYSDAGLGESATLTTMPFLVSARYITRVGPLGVHAGGGAGWYVNSLSEMTGGLTGVEDAFGYHAVAGMDFRFKDKFDLTVEVQYDFGGLTELLGGGGDPLDLSALIGRIAFAYHF